jgi:hypothetical protein
MKKSVIHSIFFLFLFICFHSSAQQNKLSVNEWLKDWYLAGPFPLAESSDETRHLPDFETDFLLNIGGENNPAVKVGQVVKFKKGSVQWIKYNGNDSVLNLDEIISKKSFVAAYAYTEIISEFDGMALLALGSNDGGRLWFNGRQVWDCPEARGFTPDDDLIPVAVKKGKNTILLKIEERGNRWEFGVRILPFNLNEFVKNTDLFRVNTDINGTPVLQFLPIESVSQKVFKTVHLEIKNTNSKNTVWEGDWSRKSKMILPVDNDKYQKYLLKIKATLTDGTFWTNEINFTSGIPVKHVLFENGKTDYSIVIGTESSESEKWAAQELQRSLFEISGAEFPIKTDESETGNHEIIIGYNRHTSVLLNGETPKPDENDETYFYENSGSNILLWGGSKRGSMYAVFSFLENELGCRWYTPAVTVFPSREKYEFTYLKHSESPSIQVRNDFYYEAFNPDWAARNKINGAMSFREQQGGVEGYWSVHTFYPLMPPAEFYDKHPEYYSLIDGKRIHDHAQLCLTNPDVLNIITERLKETIRKNPDYLIYSVSQNDWRNPCQCDKCQAIAKKEGSESGPVIWFVNQVADRIKDEFPDKYVGTLAYQYTRKPPANIVPRENVVVRFCSIECCFAHDFESCSENQDFLADLKGWSAIAPHMYIWDYVVNFSHYIMPYPNFKVLQQNIKTFRDNKSIGIMEQAAYQSRGGEFAELRAYLIGKLLWNVDVNVDEIINDFMSGYYGRSGQYVREYFDFLHGRLTPETHIHLGLRPDDVLFSGDFVREADKIFDKAERVADNEEIRRRVEMARLPVMYLKCKSTPMKAICDGTYDRFKLIVKREGITHFAEAGQAHVESFYRQMESIKK